MSTRPRDDDKWCGRHAIKDDACPQCTISLTVSQKNILGSYCLNYFLIVDGHTRRSMRHLAEKGLLKVDSLGRDGYSITEFGKIVYGRTR